MLAAFLNQVAGVAELVPSLTNLESNSLKEEDPDICYLSDCPVVWHGSAHLAGAIVDSWTYLRAPWELYGRINIRKCFREAYMAICNAYGTFRAFNRSDPASFFCICI